ncbi:MAG: hypothetical protein EXQ96_10385 [Alphaproteobacteria bacterium]|nr:hypothetical protein [Alphaproteobacteria bacterium]
MSRLIALLIALLAGAGTAGAVSPPVSSNQDLIGEVRIHVVQGEETMLDLTERYSLGYTELMAANPGVDPWLPPKGLQVVLPTAHVLPTAPRRGLVINLGDQRLYYFRTNGTVITYALGIGREGLETPLGTTHVANKRAKPTWHPTARMRAEDPTLPVMMPPGPDNPLGTHALDLGWPLYLIHGTNNPDGIGRRLSSGCLRLYPADIVDLFPQVPVGTPVTVVDQALKLGWRDSQLYLEIHPSQKQADEIEDGRKFTPEPITNLLAIIEKAAGAEARRLDWAKVARAAEERRGLPVRITR